MKKLILIIIAVSFSFSGFSQITNPRAWAEYEETRGIILNQPFRWKNITPASPQWVINSVEEHDSVYVMLINEALLQNIDVYYIMDTIHNTWDFNKYILDTMAHRYNVDILNPKFHAIKLDGANYIELTSWVRDHGPMNIYEDEVDTLYSILFNDDRNGAGKVVSDYLQIPSIEISDPATGGLSSDGGNYMVDGMNMAIIDAGQPADPAQLPSFSFLFGLINIHVLPNYLNHIDYYMKLVNEETLLVSKQLPSNYTTGFEMYDYLTDSTYLANAIQQVQQNAISQYGRPVKIVKIPNAPSYNNVGINLTYLTNDASYMNSLIVNDAVIVPQYLSTGTDTTAINIYKEVMPGYKIIPVNCRQLAAGGGAVHCITNSVATDEPIWIRHAWLSDTIDQTTDYEIDATIKTRSGINNATLYWTTNQTLPYQSVSMINLGGDNYRAIIPGQSYGTRVNYYIEAEANSGKTGNKPLVAPNWTYNFLIGEGGASGIPKINTHISIDIYPNPAIHEINFSLNKFSSENCEIHIYDIWGRTIARERIASGSIKMNTSEYKPGLYLYVITEIVSNRFVSGSFIKL